MIAIITIGANNLTKIQKDFIVKSGFALIGNNFIRKSKNTELHQVILQISSKSIPFSLKIEDNPVVSAPCFGCNK